MPLATQKGIYGPFQSEICVQRPQITLRIEFGYFWIIFLQNQNFVQFRQS